MLIKGFATPEGTKRYFNTQDRSKYIKSTTEFFTCGKISAGTHLGDMSDEHSMMYRDCLKRYLYKYSNFVDTAINYRGMRSERDLGVVLKELLLDRKVLSRDEIIISSKGGILPGDIEANLYPDVYIKEKLIDTGIICQEDIYKLGNIRTTLNPKFYDFAINESRKHLNLDTIDIHYIHVPSVSRSNLSEEEFYTKLQKLFEFYESAVDEGRIKHYGFASWRAFLSDDNEDTHISLSRVVNIAETVRKRHHFKFIMLPYNPGWQDAQIKLNQQHNGEHYSFITLAKKLGINIITSAPLAQMDLPDDVTTEDALKFSLNNPNLTSLTVGMKQISHLDENMKTCIN